MSLSCRCPQESGALFLYRKIEAVLEQVLLAAPPVKVTDEEAEAFISKFNETLESVDAETIAKAAAPAEGEAAAGGHSSTPLLPCLCQLRFSDSAVASDWPQAAPFRTNGQAAVAFQSQ